MYQNTRVRRIRRISLLAIVIAALMGGDWVSLRAQQEVFGPLFCKFLPFSSATYWISLPPEGPIRSAAELYDMLGGSTNVIHVREMFPESNQRTFDGTCTNAETSPTCATSTYPDPCFCIAPGEGVEVRLTSPRVLRIFGNDSSTTIFLTATATPERYLISLPYRAAIADASDLLLDIGTANISEVRRFNSSTGAVEVYRASGPPGVDFAVVPGEAYQVVVRPGVNFAYVPSVYAPITFPSCPSLCQDFLISGTGEGFLFAAQISDSSAAAVCAIPYDSFASGDDAATMAWKFRDFVSNSASCQAAPATSTSPLGTSAPVFRICLASSGPPVLTMAPVPCVVTATGCTFNPTIQAVWLPPDDPGYLAVDKNGTDAILSWNDIGDSTLTWNVYRDGDLWAPGILDSDAGTPGIQWVDPDIPIPGTYFRYVVTAVNSFGESPH